MAGAHSHVSYNIKTRGAWEPGLVRSVVNLLADARLKHPAFPHGLVMDMGANLGQYSLAAAAMGFYSIVIEPIPEHVEMIARSVVMNGLESRAFLFRNALSSSRHTQRFTVDASNKGGSGFVPDSGHARHIDVDVITLDDLLPRIKELGDLNISWFKADVEGFEPYVFQGAPKLFAHARPEHLQFELQGWSFARTGVRLPPSFSLYVLKDVIVLMLGPHARTRARGL